MAPASRSAPNSVYAFESRTCPKSGCLGRRDQLIARREHHHPRPRVHERRRVTRVRQQPQLGRPEALAAFDEHAALLHVLARGTDVTAFASRLRTAARSRCAPGCSRRERRNRLRRGSARRSRSAPPRRRPRSRPADVRSWRGRRSSARRDVRAWHRRRRPLAPRTRPCRWRRTPAARSWPPCPRPPRIRRRRSAAAPTGTAARSTTARVHAHPRPRSSLQRSRDRAHGEASRPWAAVYRRPSNAPQTSFLRWTKSASQLLNSGPRSSRSIANSTVALR